MIRTRFPPRTWLGDVPRSLLGTLAVISWSACSDGVAPPAGDLVSRYGLTPLPAMVFPADNPPNAERVELGRLLFFDPIMSGRQDVACGTCHVPAFAMADGRDLPAGPSGTGIGPARVLTDPNMVLEARNSPTVLNAGFNRFLSQPTADGFLFWDGRKRRLENLVTLPQREFSEMRADAYPVEETLDTVLARLRSFDGYVQLFARAFPEKAPASPIDSASLSMALAQFVRSLVSNQSPYDRFVAGDSSALSEQQRRGLVLFHEKGDCARCHAGPMFSDFDFHVVGAKQLGPGFQFTPHEDLGRWDVTHLDGDRWRFRTPSLRNAGRTGPYMHSGGYESLRDAVAFFNRGGGDNPGIPKSRIEIRPLGLNERDIDDLVAFLQALSDVPEILVPSSLPSGLDPPRPE